VRSTLNETYGVFAHSIHKSSRNRKPWRTPLAPAEIGNAESLVASPTPPAACAQLARAHRFALLTSIDVVGSPERLDVVAQVNRADLAWLALVTNGL